MTTFNYTGSEQTYSVPDGDGIKKAVVECYGAGGGDGGSGDADGGSGASGGFASAEIDVTPGETLYVYVGQQGGNGEASGGYADGGAGGWNDGGAGGDKKNDGASNDVTGAGGGGGGSSDVRRGGNTISDRAIVAGGGGGGGGGGPLQDEPGSPGGTGGGSTGGGNGGTQSDGYAQPDGGPGLAGSDGESGSGGGGGGFWGGYGGNSQFSGGAGGGGGSGFIQPSANSTTLTQGGGNAGNGQVVITVETPAPSGLSVDYRTSDDIALTWSIAGPNDPDEIKIYRSTSAGVTTSDTLVTTLADGTKRSYEDTGLSSNTDYYYAITAVWPDGESSLSNEVTTTTKITGPLNLSVTDTTATSIDLSWDPPASNYESLIEYQILRAEAAGSEDPTDYTQIGTVPSGTTAYSDTGLDEGATYYYRVNAKIEVDQQ